MAISYTIKSLTIYAPYRQDGIFTASITMENGGHEIKIPLDGNLLNGVVDVIAPALVAATQQAASDLVRQIEERNMPVIENETQAAIAEQKAD